MTPQETGVLTAAPSPDSGGTGRDRPGRGPVRLGATSAPGRRRWRRRRRPLIVGAIPFGAVLAALAVGALLILGEGQPPLAVYRTALTELVDNDRAPADIATAATPLILIGLGYAVAYRARVFSIGAEGQYLVGALAAVAVMTTPGATDLPSAVLIALGASAAVSAGAAWSGLAGWLAVRFGASVVISSLMLVYLASALLQWAVRDGLRDPDSFIPATRQIDAGSLPAVGDTHLGFPLALLVAAMAVAVLSRHRAGFRITALGLNREAVDANEVRSARVVLGVMLAAGALAGLAGFVEVAGVTGRLNGDSSVGYGWDAIVVALLGRLGPVGVVIAGLGLAWLTIGLEAGQRSYDLPSSLVGVITALIVVFVVVGDAIAGRFGSEA